MRKMVSKKPIGGSHEPETELRPDSSEHPGLAGDTGGIEPILAQKMLDFEKEWLKVARRGPRMAGARQFGVALPRTSATTQSVTTRYFRDFSILRQPKRPNPCWFIGCAPCGTTKTHKVQVSLHGSAAEHIGCGMCLTN